MVEPGPFTVRLRAPPDSETTPEIVSLSPLLLTVVAALLSNSTGALMV